MLDRLSDLLPGQCDTRYMLGVPRKGENRPSGRMKEGFKQQVTVVDVCE